MLSVGTDALVKVFGDLRVGSTQGRLRLPSRAAGRRFRPHTLVA